LATIALLGASGSTGRLVAAELARGRRRVVLAAPDVARLRRRLDEQGIDPTAFELRPADAQQAASLDELLADVDLVIDLAGPYERHGRAVVEAAMRAGVHHLDAALEPAFVSWVHGQHRRAAAADTILVPAGGFPGALLDLLASAALGAVSRADEVHLATTFTSRGGLRRGTGPTTRGVLARLLADPMEVRAAGRTTEEPVAEARRLAWFPRPVGLAHAAGVPGSAHLSVPRHVAGLDTVREYLAVSGWQAELLQLAGNAARWDWSRRHIAQAVGVGRGEPPPRRREDVRWACVAETRGLEGIARAWANGRDPAATAAAGLVVLADAVLDFVGPAGVRAPAELASAARLLDRLSAGRELRWSVIRPD
jgi:short subunit dehydrogenase-like uncharacterized protein